MVPYMLEGDLTKQASVLLSLYGLPRLEDVLEIQEHTTPQEILRELMRQALRKLDLHRPLVMETEMIVRDDTPIDENLSAYFRGLVDVKNIILVPEEVIAVKASFLPSPYPFRRFRYERATRILRTTPFSPLHAVVKYIAARPIFIAERSITYPNIPESPFQTDTALICFVRKDTTENYMLTRLIVLEVFYHLQALADNFPIKSAALELFKGSEKAIKRIEDEVKRIAETSIPHNIWYS